MADDQEQMKLGGGGCCGNPGNQYLEDSCRDSANIANV